ncbi:MAG: pirin family protein [Saccharospirillum sp.]
MTTPTDPVILRPRAQDLMGLPIRRVLPQAAARQCGPFVFLDHMGPHTLPEGQGVDVPPHPHIGLATVTWLFSGKLVHKDSLGSDQIIAPGDLNWMTAGRGIAHSERSPDAERQTDSPIEGLQFWVAQPETTETGAPRFEHVADKDLPHWHEAGADWTLVAGEWQIHRAPAKVDSPLVLLDSRSQQAGQIMIKKPTTTWQWGLYLLQGDLRVQQQPLERHHLLVTGDTLAIDWKAGAHFVVFGGEPLGPRRMDWNFVASAPALIDDARQRWQNHQFDPVPGDDGYVPYPTRK